MLAELIMATYGWDEVWALVGHREDQPPGPKLRRASTVFKIPHFYVGVLTGPDKDLVCVRQCNSKCEAERNLAPPGYTVLDATLRSLVVRLSNDLAKHLQTTYSRIRRENHQSGSRAR